MDYTYVLALVNKYVDVTLVRPLEGHEAALYVGLCNLLTIYAKGLSDAIEDTLEKDELDEPTGKDS